MIKVKTLKRIAALPGKLTRFVGRGFKRSPEDFYRRVSGVIHVGANAGQEREMYEFYDLSVVWIEPIPEVFAVLNDNLKDYPRQKALQYLVTDANEREYKFHIASNEGQSSSILDFDLHTDIWAEIHYEKSITLSSRTLEFIVEAENIAVENYDALIMDTQGTELLVLKGAEKLLRNFKYIKTEAADFEVYKDCCQVKDLARFLGEHGFRELTRTTFAERADGGKCYDIVYKNMQLRRKN